jgi:hypothetical protein
MLKAAYLDINELVWVFRIWEVGKKFWKLDSQRRPRPLFLFPF